MPAGKVKKGESLAQAMQREFWEETGNWVLYGYFIYFNKIYVKYPETDFIYHTFHLILNRMIDVKTNPNEHKAHDWLFPQEALKKPLIPVLPELIKLFYKI